jgi:oligoribonuclease NrnB/cAMP/cGMP phosphodiesterase (DHH superfamily)
VQEICSKYFNGGGHLNASGGQTKESLNDTMKKLKEALQVFVQTDMDLMVHYTLVMEI